ncbi:hypothetical protein N7520_002044 [Penicillium odoratum]|uniref:uncharacterized protein n=1 Tax=Penicillium odoratum TaxID=1167516 RepID=UPI00254837A6|nr:uncharacterized protein N7520_002044 [Penicillium odoratum]KAJ5778798.1 hypothetical protein N7520_002044 [Penicillium odoratum]
MKEETDTTANQELVNDMKLNAEIQGKFTYHDTFEHGFSGGAGGEIRETWERGKELGRGGFGSVWLEKCVTDQGPARLRAVKKIPKPHNRSQRIYCDQELQAIAKFSQQRYKGLFVRCLGWFDTPESIFITMEHIKLGTLGAHLRAPLPEGEARRISSQLLLGLQNLHKNHFAHRDLKPDNIFVMCVGPSWWVKIGDFGLSKRYNRASGLKTNVGTKLFLAPEVLLHNSESTYTHAVDMWSLGVTIFFALTHVYPFESIEALCEYYKGNSQFPFAPLASRSVSQNGQRFLEALLKADASTRMPTQEALESAWLGSLATNSNSPIASQLASKLTLEKARPDAIPGSSGALGGHTWSDFNRSSSSSTMEPDQSQNRSGLNRLQPQSLKVSNVEKNSLAEAQNTKNQSLWNEDEERSDEGIRQYADGDQQTIRRKPVGSLEHRTFRGSRVEGNYDEGNLRSTNELEDLVSMGEALLNDNDYTKAEAVYRRAFKGYRDTLGAKGEGTLRCLFSLGQALYKQTKYAEAEIAYRQAFEGYRDTLGAKDDETLKSLTFLGHALFKQGNYSEAEKAHRQVFDEHQYTFGAKHERTLRSLFCLGDILYKQKKYAEAEKILRQTFEGYRDTVGAKNSRTLSCLFSLGDALNKNEKYTEAENAYRQAFEGYRDDLGAEPEKKFDCLHAQGKTLYKQKKYIEAEKVFRQTFDGRRHTLGSKHEKTLESLNFLGDTHYFQGNYIKAEKAYGQAFEGRRDTLGETHKLTMRSLNRLGDCFYNQNQWAEAEEAYRRAFKGYRETLGASHKLTTNCLDSLGDALTRQERYDKADAAYQQASRDRREGKPGLFSRIAKFGTRK